jgi:hypothetical protein
LADSFAVAHDAVGAVELEVLCLHGIVATHLQGAGCDGRAQAGAALVETEDLVAFV